MNCSNCGCDLTSEGVLAESSILLNFDKKKNKFILDFNNLSTRDFEIKCPECYNINIDIEVE